MIAVLLKTLRFSVKDKNSELDVWFPGVAAFKGGVKVVVDGLI